MATTIDKLPEEMLVEVIEYLDGQTVKEAALVCKEWNRLISTTPRIMNKFILRINSYEEFAGQHAFEHMMSSKRHFTTANIDWSDDESKLLQLLERFGKRLTILNLKYGFWDAGIIVKILKNMPELEELEIELNIKNDDENPADFVVLKKLKKLQAHWEFFPLIEAPMLLQLKVDGLDGDLSSKNIEKLLKASPRLESFQYHDIRFLENISSGFPFQLKELLCNWSFSMNKNIERFFMSQAATVRTLKAFCDDSNSLELILNYFKQLRNLTTNFSVLVASEEFYKNLKPLPFLKILRTVNGFSSDAALETVFKNCPELEKLEVYCDAFSHENLDFISKNNKKLQFLSMKSLKTSDAKFQCLRSLELSEIDNADHLLEFLKANPTIEKLLIKYQYEICDNWEKFGDFVDETSLKQMKIVGDEKLIQDIYDLYKSRSETWITVQHVNTGPDWLQINMMRE